MTKNDTNVTSDNSDSEAEQTEQTTVQFSVVFEDDVDDEATDAAIVIGGEPDDSATDKETGADRDIAGDAHAATELAGANADDALDDDSDEGDIAQSNADHVEETLQLAKGDRHEQELPDGVADAAGEPTIAVSSRIDRELVRRARTDDPMIRAYPAFALDHVTVVNRKSGRHVLDDVSCAFHAGQLYALVADDDAQREALLAVSAGFVRPESGAVLLKSSNVNELELSEVRAHRIGLIPQRFAIRCDLDAVGNLVFAMDASGRTFLKPKPVLARDLLRKVGFDAAPTGTPVAQLDRISQRLVAIARAMACEAQVIIVDEPTADLDDEDAATVIALLAQLAHRGDPRRCVIMLTSSEDDIAAADDVLEW